MRTQTRTRLTSVFPTSDDVFQPLLYFIYYLFPSSYYTHYLLPVLRLSYLETSPLASRSGHMTEDELSRLQRPKSVAIGHVALSKNQLFTLVSVSLDSVWQNVYESSKHTPLPLRYLSTLLRILLTSPRSQIVKCRYSPHVYWPRCF